MKRIVSSLLLAMVVLSTCVFPVSAKSNAFIPETAEVVYLDNGGYIVVRKTALPVQTQGGSLDFLLGPTAAPFHVNGCVEANYYDAFGLHCWDFWLYGSFYVVPGVSSTCISSYYDYEMYYASWSFRDGWCSREGDTAYGGGTFRHLYFFQHIVNADLICDKYGDLY
jgi:hypothetical protein